MARSLLYMLDAYGLDLPDDMDLDMLKKWDARDPPDAMERRRNSMIQSLQGNPNPHIR